MLENNNKGIIKQLSKRSFLANRKRNWVLFVAIMIASFMLITIFTVGMNYYQSYKEQGIRLSGCSYDAILTSPSKEQIQSLRENKQIKHAGVYVNCARITGFQTDETLSIQMAWSDKSHWEKQRVVAMEKIKGRYPKKENELMISTKALKKLKDENANIGTSLYFSYKDTYGIHKKTFVISGIYKDFAGLSTVYVSKDFYHTTGHKSTDINAGRVYLNFSKEILSKQDIKKLKEDITIGKKQTLYMDEEKESVMIKAVGGAALLTLLFLFSAYLLIYNVIYISIVNEIQFFGLLKTIGTTNRQIQTMIQRQVVFLCITGISTGVVLGTGFSFLLMPQILNKFAENLRVQTILFHPLIFIGAICFVGITVLIGSYKPAKIAAKISPIEASNYQSVSFLRKGKTNRRKTNQRKNAIVRMAFYNLFREKKRTLLVLLSLVTSLTIYVCMVVMVNSQGARNIISSFVPYDISLWNKTFQMEEKNGMTQKFDKDFLLN